MNITIDILDTGTWLHCGSKKWNAAKTFLSEVSSTVAKGSYIAWPAL